MTAAAVRTLPVDVGDGSIEIECFDTWESALTSAVILQGITYPDIELVRDVRVVLDIGANVGAASMYFERTYPDATIYAFEPSAVAGAVLHRNVGDLARVRVHDFGLFDRDFDAPLYQGEGDGLTTSVSRTNENTEASEMASFRSAATWLETNGIETIDVLKLDTEGSELPILLDIADRLAAIQILHLEYHSDDDRRTIDQMLAPTHVLSAGRVLQLHRGELTYVAKAAYGTEADLLRNAISIPPSRP